MERGVGVVGKGWMRRVSERGILSIFAPLRSAGPLFGNGIWDLCCASEFGHRRFQCGRLGSGRPGNKTCGGG